MKLTHFITGSTLTQPLANDVSIHVKITNESVRRSMCLTHNRFNVYIYIICTCIILYNTFYSILILFIMYIMSYFPEILL